MEYSAADAMRTTSHKRSKGDLVEPGSTPYSFPIDDSNVRGIDLQDRRQRHGGVAGMHFLGPSANRSLVHVGPVLLPSHFFDFRQGEGVYLSYVFNGQFMNPEGARYTFIIVWRQGDPVTGRPGMGIHPLFPFPFSFFLKYRAVN